MSALVTPPEPRGVGQYVAGLLRGLASLDIDDEITVYVSSDCPSEILSVHDERIRFVRLRLRHDPRLLMRPLYLAWQQVQPAAASADVLHVPNLVPTVGRRMPTVTTVHDLTEWHVAAKYPPPRRAYRRLAARAIARWSDRVIVPTAATRSDVVTLLGLDPGRIAVTPYGVDPPVEVPVRRSAPNAPMGYLLYVGSDLAHKNLDRLLEAAAEVLPDRGTPLLLAGVTPASPRLEATDQRWVRALGRVEPDDLASLYRGATGLVFPSLAEGFGLPVLEAFANGCPVLTSSGTACAEVAGGAALLVDPTSSGAIAAGMRRLLDDEQLRHGLVTAGHRRAAELTWERCAALTRAAYADAIDAYRAGTR